MDYNIIMRTAILALAATGLILAAVSLTGSAPEETLSIDPAFEDFVATYRKSYFSLEEYKFRAAIFAENKAEAEAMTLASKWARYGINEFSDLTQAEFDVRMGLHPKATDEFKRIDHYPEEPFPKMVEVQPNVDWSQYEGPIKNQASCGSCWAFAGTGSIEINCAMATGEFVDLAEQEIVDCAE
jgi:hypothetical protein